MLDLGHAVRSEAGVDVAADTDDPLAFYVVPPAPSVAMIDGVPQVQLLRLVHDGVLLGGHLQLALELVHPPAMLEAAREGLIARFRSNGVTADDVALRPLPVVTAEAELLFVGREATADGGLSGIVRRGYGRTVARFDAPHSAMFSVPLTPDGVRLIEAAMRTGGTPIGVVYRLGIEGLWPTQRVVAHVDWARVYDHVSSQTKVGSLLFADDVRRIAESLVETRAISVQVVQSVVPTAGQPPPDPGPALAWVQRELVERFCEPVMLLSREPAHASLGTFGEMFAVGSAFAFKDLRQIEQAVADVDFQRSMVVSRTLTSQIHLADLVPGRAVDGLIADAALDHPFFRRFTLALRTARPLADLHISELVADVVYGSARDASRLAADQPAAEFESWSDASPDGNWTIQPTLIFAADAPLDPGVKLLLAPITGNSREFSFDLERLLGLLRIEVSGNDDPRVILTRVTLTLTRGAVSQATQEVVLAPGAPPAAAWFRDIRPDDRITAKARYLLADGRTVDGPALPVDTRLFRLPTAFADAMTVQLIGDDDWSDLETVMVSLQKADTLPAGTFTFDKPGMMLPVNLDMPDPTDRSYRYRMARTWSTGRVEEDDWVTTDVPVVLVGRTGANRLVVDVVPVGPELPTVGVLLIQVDLSYIDAEHQVRDIQTAVIRARSDRFHWDVAISDPNRRSYQYRVTVNPTSGTPRIGPWVTSAERILPIPIVST